jgi:release factor glutamine methyltransferase
MDVFIGRSARVGEPTRLQYQRKRVSGWLQAGARPYISWWMGKERTTRVRTLRITVPVGVFPPKFFLSTTLMCRTLASMNLHGHTVLEVGSGSGAVSLVAAQRGAEVTAVDLSDRACYATRRNAAANGLTIDVRESDLFAAVDGTFDLVVVNPPYFRHDPASQFDHAFHAGAEFQYFHRLFEGLGEHLHPGSEVLMVLTEGGDGEIARIAEQYGYTLTLRRRSTELLQYAYVLAVTPSRST